MAFEFKHGAAKYFPILKIAGDAAARAPVALNKAVCVIGRRWGVNLPLASKRVSKLHALIVREREGVYVRDLASRNHVFVNDEPVRETELVTGDVVRVGPYALQCASGFGDRNGDGAPGSRAPAAFLEPDRGGVPPVPLDSRAQLIGNRAECDVVLEDDERVSAVHAVVFELDGKRYVRDLNSGGGTSVNGKPVHQEELAPGDELRVGRTRIRYTVDESRTTFDDAFDIQDEQLAAAESDSDDLISLADSEDPPRVNASEVTPATADEAPLAVETDRVASIDVDSDEPIPVDTDAVDDEAIEAPSESEPPPVAADESAAPPRDERPLSELVREVEAALPTATTAGSDAVDEPEIPLVNEPPPRRASRPTRPPQGDEADRGPDSPETASHRPTRPPDHLSDGGDGDGSGPDALTGRPDDPARKLDQIVSELAGRVADLATTWEEVKEKGRPE